MFTVKIIYRKTNREVLISAKNVEFVRPGEGVSPESLGLLINHAVPAEGGFHLGMTPEGDEDKRDVFVMNDAGQTVARYEL